MLYARNYGARKINQKQFKSQFSTQSTSKASIQLKALQKKIPIKKVVLSVCWNFKGIGFFLASTGQYSDQLEVYYHQLDKLNHALQHKRLEIINGKGVVFHQDNARFHTNLVTPNAFTA